MADPAFAAAFARDDGRDAVPAQVGAQPIGVVALVGTQAVDPAGTSASTAGAAVTSLALPGVSRRTPDRRRISVSAWILVV